jgi:hypothetical protein
MDFMVQHESKYHVLESLTNPQTRVVVIERLAGCPTTHVMVLPISVTRLGNVCKRGGFQYHLKSTNVFGLLRRKQKFENRLIIVHVEALGIR